MRVPQVIGRIYDPKVEPPIHFWLEHRGGTEGVHILLRASYEGGQSTDLLATDENGTVWIGPSKSIKLGLWFNGQFEWDPRFKHL